MTGIFAGVPRTRSSAFALLLLLSAAACSSSSDGTSGGGPVDNEHSGDGSADPERPPVDLPEDVRAALARPDQVTANVTWKPSTKVIEEARLRAVLDSPFSADGTYVFDGSAAEITALVAGDVVVWSGVGIFRVLSVTPEGGSLRVATEPVALDEAADEVDIHWDVATAPSSQVVDYEPDSPSQADGVSTKSHGFLGARDYKGNLDGFDVSFGVKPSPGSGDTYDFAIGGKQVEGESSGAFAAVGWAARFRTQGDIVVQGGKFVSAKVAVTDATAEATVKMGMARLSSKKSFDFPPLLVIPFNYAGLPLFISVGASVDFEATGKSTTAILGTAKLGVRGDASFELTAGSGSKFASELKDLKTSWVGGEHTATVDVGLGTVVSFPKLSFGIGLPLLQDYATPATRKALNEGWKSVGLGVVAKLQHAVVASAYVKLSTELVYNVSVDYDGSAGVPIIKGTCAEVGMNGAIFYGGELKLFGLKLSKDLALPGKLFDTQSAGRVGEPMLFGKTCKK
ncbi:MAG: hypothetical protein JWP97_3016 [Labilithrix sp.]|nr:hypothetical protein [Labilithrix sp.]